MIAYIDVMPNLALLEITWTHVTEGLTAHQSKTWLSCTSIKQAVNA